MIRDAFAAEVPIGGPKEGFEGIGPLGLVGIPVNEAPRVFATLMSNIVAFMTIIAALWFMFQIFIAGYTWLSAGGDKQKLAEAQGKLTQAIVGLVMVVIAIFLVRLVTTLLGIEVALDPIRALELIRPR